MIDVRGMAHMEPATQDALAIWQAGVDAVRADRVLQNSLRWDGKFLTVQNSRIDLSEVKRLILVGAGKAGGGMLQGLLDVLEPDRLPKGRRTPQLSGWINVPQGAIPDALLNASMSQGLVHRVRGVSICEARPSGVNEPTEQVLAGTQEILRLVQQAGPDDVVVFLLSGGGSALLSAPNEWLTLETKIAITRAMSSRGAGIQQLNAVRRALSQVKGGGLLRRCNAGKLFTLVISDVLGDPLEMIGSGPTMLEPAPDPHLAASLLNRYAPGEFPQVVSKLTELGADNPSDGRSPSRESTSETKSSAQLFVLANNQTAVNASARYAENLGFQVQSESKVQGEGTAEGMGQEFARKLIGLGEKSVWISGGEPTVVLPEAKLRGQGGRNQQLVLSAARELLRDRWRWESESTEGRKTGSLALVSGGTDGEDGSTAVAGAWIDSAWLHSNSGKTDEIDRAIERCDSHSIFRRLGGLLDVGATHTNVCDLRVLLRG